MRSYSLSASAKINLYLEIIGARPDGYHELAMVLQSIDLADQIDLRSS
jgi:4-diphosphocytidyl-2-C-methyl-D-erythritol kinase